jgi:hypothetical protein
MKVEHDILTISKPGWTFYPCGGDAKGVQIHFECTGKGKLRLDIGVHPYEGSIEKKSDRLETLKVQLSLKAELHHRIREVLDNRAWEAGIEWVVRGRRPNSTISCGASTGPPCVLTSAPPVAEKKDTEEPADHALDRSRGGLTCKIHILCDGAGPLSGPSSDMLRQPSAEDLVLGFEVLDLLSQLSTTGGDQQKEQWINEAGRHDWGFRT